MDSDSDSENSVSPVPAPAGGWCVSSMHETSRPVAARWMVGFGDGDGESGYCSGCHFFLRRKGAVVTETRLAGDVWSEEVSSYLPLPELQTEIERIRLDAEARGYSGWYSLRNMPGGEWVEVAFMRVAA